MKAKDEIRLKALESYQEADIVLLISLLDEYSKKISNLCDKIEDSKATEHIAVAGVLFCLGMIVIFFWNFSSIDNRPILAGVLTIAGLPIIPILFKIVANAKKRRKSVRDVMLLSKKLERVVQILSQVRENQQGNISSRIEMDFRLTEAEQSLERAIALDTRQKVKGLYE
jgi:hypothetical protein